MRGLFFDPPYTRTELKNRDVYINALKPGSHLMQIIHEMQRDGRKPVRAFKHDVPRLFVPKPNFVRHLHDSTIDEMWESDKPACQVLQEISSKTFRLPLMLR